MNINLYIDNAKTFCHNLWVEFKRSIRQVSIDGIGWTALIALLAVS